MWSLKCFPDWEWYNIKVFETDDPNHFWVECDGHGKILFPGYPEGYYENHFLHSFELDDGKIKRNREFMNVFQQLRDRYRSGQTLMGISSGLTDLDAKIGGFQPGQLIVVAGRPAMGKTTFAMSCSIHAALKERKSVLALSLEMSNGQLIDRAVASVGKIPLNMIRNGTACEEYGAELGPLAIGVDGV